MASSNRRMCTKIKRVVLTISDKVSYYSKIQLSEHFDYLNTPRSQRVRISDFLLYYSFYGRLSHTLHRYSRDQSDGIYNSYSPVAMDLWQRKPTSPSGFALVLGWFTAINPRRPGYNYYIISLTVNAEILTVHLDM